MTDSDQYLTSTELEEVTALVAGLNRWVGEHPLSVSLEVSVFDSNGESLGKVANIRNEPHYAYYPNGTPQ